MERTCDYCGTQYNPKELAREFKSLDVDHYCCSDCEYYGEGMDNVE